MEEDRKQITVLSVFSSQCMIMTSVNIFFFSVIVTKYEEAEIN